jgi:hypothetical protein
MGARLFKSIHIFFDTCIIFAIINESEPLHIDCCKIMDLIKKKDKVSGFINNIVEEEFHQVIGYRFDSFLEQCTKIFKKNPKTKFVITQDAFTGEDHASMNFLNLLFSHLFKEKPDIDNYYELLKEITKIRTIIRKKYMEIVDKKAKIIYRGIEKENIKKELEKRVQNFKDGLRNISIIDRRILIYYDYLTDPHPYSGFLTFDSHILEKRLICMQKLYKKYLNIINPVECLYILSGAPEYEELINEICKKCFKVLVDPSNGDICEACKKREIPTD